MIPKTVPKKYHERIDDWDLVVSRDGRFHEVWLRDGWEWDIDPSNEIHFTWFTSVKDAVALLRDSKPCHCEGCIKAEKAELSGVVTMTMPNTEARQRGRL